MNKTCFVIMGFGIKNNINLDLTYENIIKPCLLDSNLMPVPIYEDMRFNAFRCDEISGSTLIDYKFVVGLAEADIVIADISTLNINAIYELGVRHALKPNSTIILCSKNNQNKFDFFDLTYVPIIFYNHNGLSLENNEIQRVKNLLFNAINFAKEVKIDYPDNPIQRALIEKKLFRLNKSNPTSSVYSIYKQSIQLLDNEQYDEALPYLKKLTSLDSSESNMLLYILAKYKIAEKSNSVKGLIECLNYIYKNIDVENSYSEELYGRIAAIALRIFNINGNSKYFYIALDNYRKGSMYCKNNLYCPRNYCAVLLRIHEVTKDLNVIKEYYYTAKHFAKMYINLNVNAKYKYNFEQLFYYENNLNDLYAIINDKYIDEESIINNINNNNEITTRQKDTVIKGIIQLKSDINIIYKLIHN